MINLDDFLKLVLVLSISFAIVGISYQIMRLFSKFTTILEDLRNPIKNINELSDSLLQDYKDVRGYLKSFGGVVSNLNKLMSSLGFLSFFKNKSKD